MTSGPFPFFLFLTDVEGVAEAAPTAGIFCLFDLRLADSGCGAGAEGLEDLLAFRFLLDGAVEDGGRFGDVVELEAIDALDVSASVEAAAWLAACLADDLVILEDMSTSQADEVALAARVR